MKHVRPLPLYVALAFSLVSSDCCASDCGVHGAKPVMDIDVVAERWADVNLPHGLRVHIRYEGSGADYSLTVSKATADTDEKNLLVRSPHGPDPSDLSAWSHYWKTYPNIRRFPVPGYNVEVIVDLRDVHTELSGEEKLHPDEQYGGRLPAKFVGGTAHVCRKARVAHPPRQAGSAGRNQ